MKEIELKPCPFCGGKAVIHIENGACVICKECGSRTRTLIDGIVSGKPTGGAIYKIIDTWNKRTVVYDKEKTLNETEKEKEEQNNGN